MPHPMLAEGKHDLTAFERTAWGICPVCGAGHGEGCRYAGDKTPVVSEEGFPVHVERLSKTPKAIIVQYIR